MFDNSKPAVLKNTLSDLQTIKSFIEEALQNKSADAAKALCIHYYLIKKLDFNNNLEFCRIAKEKPGINSILAEYMITNYKDDINPYVAKIKELLSKDKDTLIQKKVSAQLYYDLSLVSSSEQSSSNISTALDYINQYTHQFKHNINNRYLKDPIIPLLKLAIEIRAGKLNLQDAFIKMQKINTDYSIFASGSISISVYNNEFNAQRSFNKITLPKLQNKAFIIQTTLKLSNNDPNNLYELTSKQQYSQLPPNIQIIYALSLYIYKGDSTYLKKLAEQGDEISNISLLIITENVKYLQNLNTNQISLALSEKILYIVENYQKLEIFNLFQFREIKKDHISDKVICTINSLTYLLDLQQTWAKSIISTNNGLLKKDGCSLYELAKAMNFMSNKHYNEAIIHIKNYLDKLIDHNKSDFLNNLIIIESANAKSNLYELFTEGPKITTNIEKKLNTSLESLVFNTKNVKRAFEAVFKIIDNTTIDHTLFEKLEHYCNIFLYESYNLKDQLFHCLNYYAKFLIKNAYCEDFLSIMHEYNLEKEEFTNDVINQFLDGKCTSKAYVQQLNQYLQYNKHDLSDEQKFIIQNSDVFSDIGIDL